MNNKYFTVCGLLLVDGRVLLVRHTYGTAKDRILLPGGYVHEGELPTTAVEREIFEETGVCACWSALLLQNQSNTSLPCCMGNTVYGDEEDEGNTSMELVIETWGNRWKKSRILS